MSDSEIDLWYRAVGQATKLDALPDLLHMVCMMDNDTCECVLEALVGEGLVT